MRIAGRPKNDPQNTQTHKIVWLILAVLLPVLLVASIALRHAEPVNQKIPKIESNKK